MDANQLNFPYTNIELTQAIDVVPNQFGRINELNVFPAKGIASEYAEIRFRNGYITILAAKERGADTIVNKGPNENAIILKIPHFPEIDLVTPKDIQNMYAFQGSVLRPKRAEDALLERLEAIKAKHDITREFLRTGAMKGIIIDGSNSTIYNLFTVFGVTQKVINFELTTTTTDVRAKCNELRTHMRLNLKGETMTGIRCMVDSEFWDAFTGHPNVEKYYLNWQEARTLSQDISSVFPFGGILWEQYDAVAPNVNGDSVPFIDAASGYAYPEGTRNTAATWDGPVDDIRLANEPGVQIYVSPEPLKHGGGIELKSQSNPLPVWSRPALLVKVTKS